MLLIISVTLLMIAVSVSIPLCYVCFTAKRSPKNDRFVAMLGIIVAAFMIASYTCLVIGSKSANDEISDMEKRGNKVYELRLKEIDKENKALGEKK